MENNIKEFRNAIMTIKGNSLLVENSIYSISNIVSVTFDSMSREVEEPPSIQSNLKRSKLLFKLFIFFISVTIVLVMLEVKNDTINQLMPIVLILIPASLVLSILFYFISKFKKWTYNKTETIHGLRIVFSNNMSLYFLANSKTKFIEEAIQGLQKFISDPNYRNKVKEMIVNFNQRTINIEKAESSIVNSGDIGGSINNG